jgi:23S rRNA pseudouridine2605 synthase
MTHRKRSPQPPSRPAQRAASEDVRPRLQKVLAAAGVASRRQCEQLIREGRVEVDRTVVTELGTRVDPLTQEIRVDGTALRQPRRVYFMLNKPPGVVCTNRDPSGRTRVVDLIESDERLFTVGRLDRTSEGLIIVTNDGELANQLTHPRYGVDKTYAVCVAGQPSWDELNKLRTGVHLAEGFVKVAALEVKRRNKQSTDLEIVLNEGRNREIRRILARVGHKVLRLKRIAVGPVRLGELPVAAYRRLTSEEVRKLEAGVGKRGRGAGARKAEGSGVRGGPRGEAQGQRAIPRPKKPVRRPASPQLGPIISYEDPDE